MGLQPVGKHAHRPLRSRDDLLRRARARRPGQDSGAARQMPVPARRLFRRRSARSRCVLAALHSGGLRHPDPAHHVAGAVHQYLAVRALSRRRSPRGGLFHGATDRARRAHDRHGPRRDQAPQPDPAGQAALRDADAVDHYDRRRVRAPDEQMHRAQRCERDTPRARGVGEEGQAARPGGELLHRVRRHLQRTHGPALQPRRHPQRAGRDAFARPGPRHRVRAAGARPARRAVQIHPLRAG